MHCNIAWLPSTRVVTFSLEPRLIGYPSVQNLDHLQVSNHQLIQRDP